MNPRAWLRLLAVVSLIACGVFAYQTRVERHLLHLPSSKQMLTPSPGRLSSTNSFPAALATSPDGRWLALVNAGFGTAESEYRQSIAAVDTKTHQVADFPDARLGKGARQSYFLGLGFSGDGRHLYAPLVSVSAAPGGVAGMPGNGVAVYSFEQGRVAPERFIPIAPQPLAAGKHVAHELEGGGPGSAVPYPAGIAVISLQGHDQILVADNASDDALLLDVPSGAVVHRFDLSDSPEVPADFPYGAAATRDGRRGFISLWNASQVVELDLEHGRVLRRIPLLPPASRQAPGSHPTAMLLSPDEAILYVVLSNRDAVAAIDAVSGRTLRLLSTRLPGQQYGGSFPVALAQTSDGTRLFVADASANAIAVYDVGKNALRGGGAAAPLAAAGVIPTDWYPTAVAVNDGQLWIASGKGEGSVPNARIRRRGTDVGYIPTLLHGSISRLSLRDAEARLGEFSREVEDDNLMRGAAGEIAFSSGRNPIRHVVYILKENRTYDQVFGDLTPGDGDPSLCMYGEDVTPNQHKLARQFGILDNFYDSGEVSGNGHVWSTAAITSDYTEKTWQVAYRGHEHSYDYEGVVAGELPLEHGLPDVNEPESGYVWSNVARHGLTYRHYGEYVRTQWCSAQSSPARMSSGALRACQKSRVRPGEPLPGNLGQPHGAPSPWPWPIPLFARNTPTKPELREHFDPNFADFRVDYPDQLRVDEFLNEFNRFVEGRKTASGEQLPNYVMLRLPNDHTAGTRPGFPTPVAEVADNDLAVGRVVDAISHSPYWDDTAILILEDDAQDGADHVDAHRSIALVISKYSPRASGHPFVDHHFYTTVNMIRTLEALLGLPPLNNNDARAAPMAPLFAGDGRQPAFVADYSNRDNGTLYRMNGRDASGAEESLRMDFSHADAADAAALNTVLWRDRKGDQPLPASRHGLR
jgi:DNA-binding beta-propeller fold protein YncE